jgi:hypothetical protein
VAIAVAAEIKFKLTHCPLAAEGARYPRTPAMAAGITDHVWWLEEIATLLD